MKRSAQAAATPDPSTLGYQFQAARGSTLARDFQFQQLVSILRRRIKPILLIVACGTLLAGIVGLLIPPKYTVRAQLVVVPQLANLVGGQAGAQQAEMTAIDTHVTMLTSRDHLQRVLDSLLQESELGATAAKPAPPPGETAAELERTTEEPAALNLNELKRRLAMWIAAISRRVAGGTLRLDDLERQLKVDQERLSRVITVSFTSTSPVRAATIANRIVDLYVERQKAQKLAYTGHELARLNQRIAEVKNEVDLAGTAVQKSIQQRLRDPAPSTRDGRESDIALRELERQAALREQLYDSLLRRQTEVRYQQEIIAPDILILSRAVTPERPSSSNPILFIFPALILFSICGSLLAVTMDRLDRTLRSEQDVRDALGMPCIGVVPQLPRQGGTRPHHYVMTQPFATYTEAIRSVYAALQLDAAEPAPKVVLISSSVPGEGKTTLAVSITVYAALLGRRALLVDLDFRNPAVMRELSGKRGIFDLLLRGRKHERGILDLLLHNCPLGEVIQRIPDLGLDYLPMSRWAVDPVALCAGQQIPRLLRQLREHYDCVVIDSPPLLGITEARLLASMVDKVIFVVKWGSTRREVAHNALTLLRHVPSDVPPLVLVTQANLTKHASYRYGDAGESYVKYKKHYRRFIEYPRSRWPISAMRSWWSR